MLNMDFTQRVLIDTTHVSWVKSPAAGVWRKPLAREAAEQGHATSIVRYDPGASFNQHDHPLGEEILVLEGTFSDETGDFHAGTYFRNPPGFLHAPFSQPGCVILVKLHQFQAEDASRVCIDTADTQWDAEASAVMPLHDFGGESVQIQRFGPGDPPINLERPGGHEIYIISGEVNELRPVEHKTGCAAGTWLRNPPGVESTLHALMPSLVWIKSGHLA